MREKDERRERHKGTSQGHLVEKWQGLRKVSKVAHTEANKFIA
jgi:hypothetical protein